MIRYVAMCLSGAATGAAIVAKEPIILTFCLTSTVLQFAGVSADIWKLARSK